MCFLAYLCEAHITKILRDKEDLLHSKAIDKRIIKQRPLTVLQAMKELCQLMAVPVKIKKDTVWIRTDIPQNALSLFRSIGMKIPQKILK